MRKYEISTTIKFNSLDGAVSWYPEFCWLSRFDCTDYVDQFFFSKNPISNGYDYYDEVVFPFQMESDPELYPNLKRNRRFFNYEFGIQTKLVDHTLLNFSSNVQRFKTKKKFLHEIKFSIQLDKTPSYFKYILCNLKPYASCNDTFRPNFNDSKKKPQLNQEVF